MNIKKMAAADATRWAYAELFFGEGAGTRRKLLSAEILQKKSRIPGYAKLWEDAYLNQDFGSLAIKAMQERKKLDRSAKLGKNLRAIKRGDIRGLTTGVFVVAGAYLLARQTGYDEIIAEEAKRQYKRSKSWMRMKRLEWRVKRENAEANRREHGDI